MNNYGLSADIIENKSVKEYNFGQVVVLTSNIENFRVKVLNNFSQYSINRILINQEANFVSNNIKVLYPQAVQDYKNSLVNDFPFNPFGAFLNYTVTYNENCVLSFFYDTYTYTGGAHGSTIRKSNTFNLKTGKEIPLSAFFNSQTNYRAKVLQNIIILAEQNEVANPGIYFDDYKSLIKKYFNENSFYLTPNGIVVYYGQYEIAPYSTGIVEFLIPYQEVDNPPHC